MQVSFDCIAYSARYVLIHRTHQGKNMLKKTRAEDVLTICISIYLLQEKGISLCIWESEIIADLLQFTVLCNQACASNRWHNSICLLLWHCFVGLLSTEWAETHKNEIRYNLSFLCYLTSIMDNFTGNISYAGPIAPKWNKIHRITDNSSLWLSLNADITFIRL